MFFGVTLRSDARPSRGFLEAAIEEVVRANVGFFQAEWAAGREPPCCLGCAEVLYRPDEPGATSEIVGARQVLADGVASCQSAAAYYAGRERAVALSQGMHPGRAEQTHRVTLDARSHARAPEGYWHALVLGPGGVTDVTEEMPR